MFNPVLILAVLSVVFLGSALLRVLRLERRGAKLERRVAAASGAASNSDVPTLSLRRSTSGNRVLPMVLAAPLEFAFAATGNRIGPLHLAITGVVSAAATGFACVAASFPPVFAIIFGAASAAGCPAAVLRFAQSRYQRQFLDAFPDALDLIVRAVRSGVPAPEAIELVTREIRAPVGTEFRKIVDELRIGAELEEALQRAADRIRVPDFRFFVVSLLLQRQTGGGIAEILSNLSSIIRQRKALRLKARALAAEAQASAAIVAAAPFVAGAGLFLINRDLTSVLFIDPRGRFMLWIAAASLLSGIVAMRVLIKRNLR